jgi:hypothetical protein
MPNVVVHRPGTSEEDVYWHNPATGEDEPRVKWTFNVTVDGQLGLSFVLCPPGTPEGIGADRVYARLMAHPEWLEGILSTDGGGGGGGGGGPSGPAGSGVDPRIKRSKQTVVDRLEAVVEVAAEDPAVRLAVVRVGASSSRHRR